MAHPQQPSGPLPFGAIRTEDGLIVVSSQKEAYELDAADGVLDGKYYGAEIAVTAPGSFSQTAVEAPPPPPPEPTAAAVQPVQALQPTQITAVQQTVQPVAAPVAAAVPTRFCRVAPDGTPLPCTCHCIRTLNVATVPQVARPLYQGVPTPVTQVTWPTTLQTYRPLPPPVQYRSSVPLVQPVQYATTTTTAVQSLHTGYSYAQGNVVPVGNKTTEAEQFSTSVLMPAANPPPAVPAVPPSATLPTAASGGPVRWEWANGTGIAGGNTNFNYRPMKVDDVPMASSFIPAAGTNMPLAFSSHSLNVKPFRSVQS
eukprot:GGOE01021539.1.p1 GENE.GGOE01021539.1~~GGOE01021539.1.p1  ORF type:complete len:325 (+),score=41.26 GGOE01021539.1:39-977(+)